MTNAELLKQQHTWTGFVKAYIRQIGGSPAKYIFNTHLYGCQMPAVEVVGAKGNLQKVLLRLAMQPKPPRMRLGPQLGPTDGKSWALVIFLDEAV